MLNYAKVSSGGGQTVGGGSNDIHRVLHPGVKAVLNYAGMKVKPIQIFSYACVILGVLSILIQVSAMAISGNLLKYAYPPFDKSGHGIWTGVLYLTAGSLGIAATYKRTKSLLVSTVVISAVAIAASLVSMVLSGIIGAVGNYYDYQNSQDCSTSFGCFWRGLEWTLFTCHLMAFVSVITLTVLSSVTVCTCCATHDFLIRTLQEAYFVAANGQPVHIREQHQPEAFQVGHGEQETFFQKSNV